MSLAPSLAWNLTRRRWLGALVVDSMRGGVWLRISGRTAASRAQDTKVKAWAQQSAWKDWDQTMDVFGSKG